mgnify:CR=1 FL=1
MFDVIADSMVIREQDPLKQGLKLAITAPKYGRT